MPAEPSVADDSDKPMKLRYAGVCRLCAAVLPARMEAVYERSTKTVRCVQCPVDAEREPVAEERPVAQQEAVPEVSPVADLELVTQEELAAVIEIDQGVAGTAGSSARREYDRRKAKDEARLRERWGRLGGMAVALSSEKQSTQAWDRGAVGEERLGERLNALASASIAVMHDRRIPGTRANIDHIVVTTAGVWVIDAKRYKGRPALKVEGGLFRPRVEKLVVGGRDCTKLVDSVLKQVDLVREVVGEVPVTGVMCFVNAEWPMFGGAFTTRGIQVLWPKRLTANLKEAAGAVDVADCRQAIAAQFPAA